MAVTRTAPETGKGKGKGSKMRKSSKTGKGSKKGTPVDDLPLAVTPTAPGTRKGKGKGSKTGKGSKKGKGGKTGTPVDDLPLAVTPTAPGTRKGKGKGSKTGKGSKKGSKTNKGGKKGKGGKTGTQHHPHEGSQLGDPPVSHGPLSLTSSSLSKRDLLLDQAQSDRSRRVIARTLGGVQCCLPGLGQGEERLTFPACYMVGDALNGGEWIRLATDDELRDDDKWWRCLNFIPQCIVHEDGSPATIDQPIGIVGSEVWVLAQVRETPDCSEKPKSDLTHVPTPPTPPPSLTPRAWRLCSTA